MAAETIYAPSFDEAIEDTGRFIAEHNLLPIKVVKVEDVTERLKFSGVLSDEVFLSEDQYARQ